jgi:hypothetical protein
MHPIERLRYAVRAGPEQATAAAREAASALSMLGDDPAGLVVACRRLVDHQPRLGVMWWLASTVLAASDPETAAWHASAVLDADATAEALAVELPSERVVALVGRPAAALDALALRSDLRAVLVGLDDITGSRRRRRGVVADWVEVDELGDVLEAGDVLLVDVPALTTSVWLTDRPTLAAVAALRTAVPGAEVWGVGGAGRALPPALFDALAARVGAICIDGALARGADVDAALAALDGVLDGALDAALDGDGDRDLDAGSAGRSVVASVRVLDAVAGPDDVVEPADLGRLVTCPVAPELLRFAV